MKPRVLSAAIFFTALSPATAQQQNPKECWEAYESVNSNDYPLLLNKCTGDSYMLSPHPIEGAPNTVTGKIYTWDKIPLNKSENWFSNEPHK